MPTLTFTATDDVETPSVGFFSAARSWLSRQLETGRAFRDLSAHSDRELADMGLTRGDILNVVHGRFTRC